MAPPVDDVELCRALIRCPSVTPVDAGALAVIATALEGLGFTCHRLPFGGNERPRVENLYARLGTRPPHLCFAGHTDVVPPGTANLWSVDPFAAHVRDGRLFGRGAADMKAAIACFVAAAADHLGRRTTPLPGSLSLLITGDEEGPALDGTAKVLSWLKDRGERLDACLVGEPTSEHRLGDTIKIGRRGSLNARLVVHGTQGHAAYPQLADNPLRRLIGMLTALDRTPLDGGTAHFEPSTVTLTSIDVGNPVTNLIPARAEALFNVRFNELHSAGAIAAWIEERCQPFGGRYEISTECSGEAFLSPPGHLTDLLSDAIERLTAIRPRLGTSGGTSDARFIKDLCPVAELGMVGETAHKVDENVPLADVRTLTRIYGAVLDGFFADS
jgi:succinyl-diaminopimelate desuccinylase